MFGRTKRRVVEELKNEAVDYMMESANDGLIYTGSVLVEGLLFLGVLMIGGKNRGGRNDSHGENIHIHVHNYNK